MNGTARAQRLAASASGFMGPARSNAAGGFAAERQIAQIEANAAALAARGDMTKEQAFSRLVTANPQAYMQYKRAKRQKAFRVSAGFEEV